MKGSLRWAFFCGMSLKSGCLSEFSVFALKLAPKRGLSSRIMARLSLTVLRGVSNVPSFLISAVRARCEGAENC